LAGSALKSRDTSLKRKGKKEEEEETTIMMRNLNLKKDEGGLWGGQPAAGGKKRVGSEYDVIKVDCICVRVYIYMKIGL
jgi:hypothetical protein